MPSTSPTGAIVEELSRRHLKELDRYVEVPKLQDSTRLSVYYGMSKQVLAQAQQFRESHDIDRAYIFYKRFLRLALDCIPEHIAYKEVTFGRDKNWLVGERRQALKALEAVNSEITAEIATHHYHHRVAAPIPSNDADAAALDNHASLSRDVKAAAGGKSGGSKEEELERRLRELRGWDAPSSTRLHSPLGGGGGGGGGGGEDFLLEDELNSPSSLTSGGMTMTTSTMLEPSAPPLFLDDGPPTSLPPLQQQQQQRGLDTTTSGLSATELETAFKSLRLAEADDPSSRIKRYYPSLPSPVPKPKAEEEEAVVSPFAVPGQERWFQKRGMLRRMVLPSGLVGKFLEIAEVNSRKPPDGIETCGVLAGIQDSQGLMRCTTLIIPKQHGTSDTVGMTHEEELIGYCCSGEHIQEEGGNLLQLGWIHTHPSQSCFMSSVDIHTHCGYQTMLPEAVAVVVALKNPRKPQVGVFRLTEPEGLQLIQRCEMRGFHPHPLPDAQIYKNHHAVLWEDSAFAVVDLR